MKKGMGRLAMLAFIYSLSGGAVANLVSNGSFETPGPAGGSYELLPGASTAVTDWTTTLNGVEWFDPTIPAYAWGPAQDGAYLIDLAPFTYTGGGIKQSFATTMGETYRVTFFGSTLFSSGRDGTGQIDVYINGVLTATFNLANNTATVDWQELTFDFTATGTTTTIQFRNSEDASLHFAFIDNVAVDSLSCNGQPATIIGTNGRDVIRGTSGPDVIVSFGGNDVIYGNGGEDTICAGDGNDVVYGGAGDDFIDGGDGLDKLFGNAGDDTINGGDDKDTIDGDAGDDTLSGGAGNDSIIGDIGNDTLNGDDGDDLLTGNSGNDTINGGAGNDKLVGHSGNDILNGDDGDDKLYGFSGNDSLDGGNGTDLCDGGGGVVDSNTATNCETETRL